MAERPSVTIDGVLMGGDAGSLQGIPIAASAPTVDGQVLTYDLVENRWEPRAATGGGGGGGFTTIEKLTVSSVSPWTVPAGITTFMVDVIAGGGGGAGGNGSLDSAGGGGGGCSRKMYKNQTPGTQYTFFVGAKGMGGASGQDGTDGGNSWFENSSTGPRANGGQRGIISSGIFSGGGQAFGGDINIQGNPGDFYHGGQGGSSFYGGGASGRSSPGNGFNAPSTNVGAGGGAGYTSGFSGGNGADGAIFVWY